MEPAVSIVMPVRNVQGTLDPAVRSIVAQTWKAWELVVLDDGSTDGTVQRLQAWADLDDRIRPFVDGRSLGISARLNEGVRYSRAPIIARMDGDDICYPHRLETQLAFLRENPEVDVVGAGSMVFMSDGTPRGPRSRPGGHEELTAHPLLNGIPLTHPTWMGRRSWFLRFPYDPRARGCEDREVSPAWAHVEPLRESSRRAARVPGGSDQAAQERRGAAARGDLPAALRSSASPGTVKSDRFGQPAREGCS